MVISVVIISWNALHFLRKCLPSLYAKNKDCEFEVILVDNNSNDGTGDYVKKNFPEIRYLLNSENKGVAPARNQGMHMATGKYILILDVDTEFITEGSFKELVNYMDENQDVGLIGVQLIGSDGEVQKSRLKFPSIWVKLVVRFEKFRFFRKSDLLKNYYMDSEDPDKVVVVDYVIGAFQFIRREMVDKVGLYDEKIFYGPEDIDYCLRGKRKGFKTVYYPEVKLNHFYQRITKKVFSKITLKHIKGLIYFFWKHKYINYPK